jgi:hypothetical protein
MDESVVCGRRRKFVLRVLSARGSYPDLSLEPNGALYHATASLVFTVVPSEPPNDRGWNECRSRFTFSGAEQKHWYETRKFNFSSVPIRCKSCRRLRRSEHAMREQIARARQATRNAPTDPSAHLALVRAIVVYHERTGDGRLDDAVAAARRAAEL